MAVTGTIKLVGYDWIPRDFAKCDGRLMQISKNTALFSILGTMYGGDGIKTFGLPDLRVRAPIHKEPQYPQGSKGGTTEIALRQGTPTVAKFKQIGLFETSKTTGKGKPKVITDHPGAHSNMQPYLTLASVICIKGKCPSQDDGLPENDSDFLGDIRMFSFGHAPDGWATCDGQTLSIEANMALYGLLGTRFGGDGETTFALPDLRGRVPIGPGILEGLSVDVGDDGGSEDIVLRTREIPVPDDTTALAPGGSLAAPAMTPTQARAQNIPHNNMMPFQTVSYCINIGGTIPEKSLSKETL